MHVISEDNCIQEKTAPVRDKINHGYFEYYVCGSSSHSRIFHSYGDVTITGEGLQILTYSSALMAIEQWGFLSVSQLLCHGASIYNGHVRGPVTPIAERLAVELSLPVFKNIGLSQMGFEHPTFRLRDHRSNPCTAPPQRSIYMWSTYMYKLQSLNMFFFHSILFVQAWFWP